MLESLIGVEHHRRFYEDKGTFLPWGVLEKKGYDVERLWEKSRPEDKKETPLLGKCIRVPLLTVGVAGFKGTTRSTTASNRSRAAAGLPDDPELEAIEDGSVGEDGEDAEASSGESSSDSSSSSSSSSSSRRKKSKKNKKNRKHKSKKSKSSKSGRKDNKKKPELTAAEAKAQQALERAREREQGKKSAKEVKEAHCAISRVASVTDTLQTVLDNPKVNFVSEELAKPVKDALCNFEVIRGKAVAIIKKNGGTGLPDGKSLATMVSDARKQSALLSQILLSVAKARGN